MRIGVNAPNFGPGTGPDVLRRWAQIAEGPSFDPLMISDHVVLTPDVAEQYPAPFFEPFATLSWLAGITDRVRLGITVLIVPYRHPLLTARMAADLSQLSAGRLSSPSASVGRGRSSRRSGFRGGAGDAEPETMPVDPEASRRRTLPIIDPVRATLQRLVRGRHPQASCSRVRAGA